MLLQQLKASNEDQACKQAMKIKRSGSKLLKQTGQVIIAGIEFFKRKNPVISHQINLKGKNNATMDADFKTFCARIPLALANATRRRKRPWLQCDEQCYQCHTWTCLVTAHIHQPSLLTNHHLLSRMFETLFWWQQAFPFPHFCAVLIWWHESPFALSPIAFIPQKNHRSPSLLFQWQGSPFRLFPAISWLVMMYVESPLSFTHHCFTDMKTHHSVSYCISFDDCLILLFTSSCMSYSECKIFYQCFHVALVV